MFKKAFITKIFRNRTKVVKSKNTVYLHIGAPKTGTSAIQKSLFNNRKLLVKHGFIYPDYAQPNKTN